MTIETLGNGAVIAPVCLAVCEIISLAQSQNGVRQEDYERYRSFCASRIKSLRRIQPSLLGCSRKNGTFTKNPIVSQLNFSQDAKRPTQLAAAAEFLLWNAERAWATYLHIKTCLKKYGKSASCTAAKLAHAKRRLRSAVKHAKCLRSFVADTLDFDAATKVEAIAYSEILIAQLSNETAQWKRSYAALVRAKIVIEAIVAKKSAEDAAPYVRKLNDEIEALIRFAQYNIRKEGNTVESAESSQDKETREVSALCDRLPHEADGVLLQIVPEITLNLPKSLFVGKQGECLRKLQHLLSAFSEGHLNECSQFAFDAFCSRISKCFENRQYAEKVIEFCALFKRFIRVEKSLQSTNVHISPIVVQKLLVDVHVIVDQNVDFAASPKGAYFTAYGAFLLAIKLLNAARSDASRRFELLAAASASLDLVSAPFREHNAKRLDDLNQRISAVLLTCSSSKSLAGNLPLESMKISAAPAVDAVPLKPIFYDLIDALVDGSSAFSRLFAAPSAAQTSSPKPASLTSRLKGLWSK